MSGNNISDISLLEGMTINYFSVCNNPVYSIPTQIQGYYFLFSYKEEMSLGHIKEKFTYYYLLDCPLDKQLQIKIALTGSEYSSFVKYCELDESKQVISERRDELMTGTKK